jgi:4a-hydroxytetrahydrobiopterin dehydratase
MANKSRLSPEEARAQLAALTDWQLAGDAIRRRYTFASFKESMEFVSKVALLAERADHHPDILIEYDKVTLTLSSHDAGGLTDRDFSLARSIDA